MGAVYIDTLVLRRLLAFCVLTTYSYTLLLLLPAAEEWSATALQYILLTMCKTFGLGTSMGDHMKVLTYFQKLTL